VIVRHYGEGAPACGATVPDSSGHLETTTTEAAVDCTDCLEVLDLHVCGVDPFDPRCSGCVWLAGTDNVVLQRMA
jgi:hypothetical protein